MSLEVVTTDDGRIYIIEGSPDSGYDIHRVEDETVDHFDRKFEARRAIHTGDVW